MPFEREQMRMVASQLAAQGVFIGTSSWKYPGWLGRLYTPERYRFRGKLAMARFARDWRSEYAEVFKSVCVDAAYYDFPRHNYLERMAGAGRFQRNCRYRAQNPFYASSGVRRWLV